MTLYPTHGVYIFLIGRLIWAILTNLLWALVFADCLFFEPSVRPYYRLATLLSTLGIFAGGSAAIWAFRTGQVSLSVAVFFCEPMLVCLIQMILLQWSEPDFRLLFAKLGDTLERR